MCYPFAANIDTDIPSSLDFAVKSCRARAAGDVVADPHDADVDTAARVACEKLRLALVLDRDSKSSRILAGLPCFRPGALLRLLLTI